MIKAKKQFGQNFLKDEFFKNKIIESMPDNNHTVIEVGPGLGDLTEKLLLTKAVVAIEIDDRLYQGLKVKFDRAIREGKFSIINRDVMELRQKGEFPQIPHDLIANLPYYIATAIILDALQDPNCKNILVMVQKEVAQKFTARPGMKEYCSLSILTDMVGEAEYLFDVPKEAFTPQPKVTSAVFRIRKNDNPYHQGFADFLKVAFSQPRKRLLKNLTSQYDKEKLTNLFAELDLPETVRPHEVEAQLFFRLFSQI